jgi:MFS family permease
VVAAAFASMFTVFGVAYSFGSFFRSMADEFGQDRSSIALVFSITTLLYFGLGVITGKLADRFGPRPVLAVGGAALVLGLIVTSRVQSITAGYVTYGLGVGIGVACGYVPMVATVGGWFVRYRAAAVGVAVAGIGAGTLVVAPLTERLVAEYGWRNTYLYLAAAAAVLMTLATIGARRPPVDPASPQSVSLLAQIRSSRAFAVLFTSVGLVVLSLFVPFVFLADYLTVEGIDGSGGVLVGLIGLCSVIGRLGLGSLAARFDATRMYQGSLFTMGISFLLWLTAADRYWQLAVFAVVLGVAYGGFIALSPVVMAELYGVVGLGGLLGALYTAAGLGGFLGPPIAGIIIDRSGYPWALIAACVSAVLGSLALFALPRAVTD